MPILTIEALAEKLGPTGRLMGLDVGEKTIGLAISDPGRQIASPMETIRRGKFTKDAIALEGLIEERQALALIIGLPVNMDGSEGRKCQSIRQFGANLLERRDFDIVFWDERLSTVAVTRTLLDADMSRKRRSEVVDKMAAGYILQGALDRLAGIAASQV